MTSPLSSRPIQLAVYWTSIHEHVLQKKTHVQTSLSPPSPQTASPKFEVRNLEVIQVTFLLLPSHCHLMTSPAYCAHLPLTSHACPVSTADKHHCSQFLTGLPLSRMTSQTHLSRCCWRELFKTHNLILLLLPIQPISGYLLSTVSSSNF